MGNKHGKPRRSSNLTTPPPTSKTELPVPPSANNSDVSAPPSIARLHPLLESKLSQVDVTTIFSPLEIQAIRKHLSTLLQQHENDPIVIHREEFYRFLGMTTSSLYVNRLYAIFDMSGKGSVNFDDLIRGLSVLSQKATREQKLLLSFHLLDPDGNGYITKNTTTELLRSCLAECKVELGLTLNDNQIAQIVDTTFEVADLDHNNLVDLQEYQALDLKHPGLFDFLTVDALNVLNHLEKVQSMCATNISVE